MAPPTQAGRFKPRKPAKRVAPTAVATPVAILSAAATAAAAAPPATSTDRGDSGAGGRGAGRGGRGRGGRGTPVLPQGQVFFMGTDKPAASSTRTSATAVAAASSKRKGKAAGMMISTAAGGAKEVKSVALEVQEEVLNVDDEGMDTLPDPAPRSSKLSAASSRQSKTNNYHESHESQRAGGVANHDSPSDALAHYYDSDSDEDDEPMQDYRKDSQLQPFLIDSARSDHIASNQAAHMSTSDGNPLSQTSSPLLVQSDSGSTDHSLNHANAFFLVQLPTRLPPIISATRPDEVPKAPTSGLDIGDEDPVPVSTPAVEVGSFDNQLTDAQPGRMGTIRVYRSGRTVFVWESAPGQAVVEMNVTEGLNCSFRQQAALIDLGRKELTPLGNVQKTIVVSPELGDGYLA
ncbi:hypothetical protein FisN_6Lh299 [Fistulifera solaris]|uniref:Uncharacterized protein n=1 Tax=Fistulifera solaris TaxID=1519565 RepID=A0A1Z5J5Z7_FISSO|nr:hypothetical protein FisN_6Lh299 [Fistulifera solaris]|eukprot:GAX09332.1 hypothetical protein FisN_6Lh299 [Fistulifera solaris]